MGVLSALLGPERRTEQSFLTNPAEWLVRMFGGGTTSSGTSVTELSALSVPAYWSSVVAPSETLASLPLDVLKRRPDGGKDERPDHPLHERLHLRANPEQSAMSWREMSQMNLFLWGNAYTEIIRRGDGRVTELWPYHPARVKPDRLRNGEKVYVVTLTDGKRSESRTITAGRMLHIMGPSSEGFCGLSRLRLHAESIGLSLALQEFGARFFGSGAMSGGWLEHPKGLSDKAYGRLQAQMREFSGLAESHRVRILEEDMKFHESMVKPEHGQFLQSREHQIGEAARSSGVPGIVIGHNDKTSTYASASEFWQAYTTHTIRQWSERWEQELDWRLFTEQERRAGYYVKHNMDGLLRGNPLVRSQALEVRFRNGNLTPNQWKAIEDENPIEDESGDKYYIMSNMVPLDMAGVPPPPSSSPPDPASPDGARSSLLARLLHDIAERALRRELEAVRKLAEREAANPAAWRQGVDEFYARHAAYLSEALHVSLDTARTYTADHRAELLAEGIGAANHWEQNGAQRSLIRLAEGGDHGRTV